MEVKRLYFLVGFTLVVFININIIGLTFVAGGIAYLFYVAGEKKETPMLSANDVIEEDEEMCIRDRLTTIKSNF